MAKEKVDFKPKEETPNVETLMTQLNNLNAQNKMLKDRLNQAIEQIQFLSQNEFHKKLEWLWKVITLENSVAIFSPDFYDTCVAEFIDMMTPQVPEEEAKKSE
jgi:hypothetical protein